MQITSQFYKKKFTGRSLKRAYMQAVKWYSTNVLANSNLNDVVVQYKKSSKTVPTITIELYATFDEPTVRERQCEICEEIHGRNQSMCDKCKMKAYIHRNERSLAVKKEYYKQLLKSNLKGE